MWDLITRKRTALLGWGGQSRALAGCRAANLIAFSTTNASGQLVVQILNLSSNSSIAQIQNVGDPVSLDFSPDGGRLGISSHNPGIQLWDAATKETSLLTMALAAGGSHKGVVLFSPDGNLLAIGSTEGSIQIFDARTHVEQFRFKAFPDGISALAFSPDGEFLASGAGYSEQQIKLWNVSTGTAAGELVGHRSWVTSLAFAPDGKTLISGSGDQTIRFWDISSRREVGVLCGHQNEIYTVVLANDGHTLISGSKDGEVCIWDSRRKHENEGYATAPTRVHYIRFLPRGAGFISLDRDNSVGVWDSAKMEETRRISEWGSDNVGISVSPDGKLVAAGDRHGKLKFWDLTAGHELTNFTFQNVPSWPGRFLNNGKVLQVFDENVVVHFLETGSWRQISQWKMPAGVSALAMTPDEQLMAVGYKMGTVKLIRVADGRELATLPAHSRWITGTIFTPDGKLLVTSSEDGLVKLWDPFKYAQLATLKGHLLGVHSVAPSPDSRRLVTGSNAKEAVKIWDLATRQELLNLEGEGSQFDHTQFSPDGDVLLSINSEGVVHYWRAPPMAEIDAPEQLTNSQ
jgi:WD40 repeat protein